MHDLDWLRVIAIILLIFFHVGMVFISWTWYFMQDVETSPILDEATLFLSHWRMALLFLISGAGTLFALGYRSEGKYMKERTIRLLIPLLFGIFIIIPPQIYFELMNQGWVFNDYFEFSERYFAGGMYPHGDLSWHHLWFIAYLLLYSLLGLPVFMYFRSDKGKALMSKIAEFIEPNGRMYLLLIPLIAIQIGLRDKFSGYHNLLDDMANFAYFFLFFLYGYIICSNKSLWDSIQRQRRTSLIFAVISFSILFIARLYNYDLGYALYWVVETTVAWTWVLTIIGYGRQYLNFKNKFLAYANEGIYPLYILHQTVLIIVAYYVIQTDLSVLAKFLIISTSTFIICISLYDLVIRRNNITRFLFGMKPLPVSYLKEKREAIKAASVNFKIFERKPVNEV